MKHLYTFELIEAVARCGSMRRAAEDMNLTGSALNRRIRRFEAEFGAEIFERLPSGVRLNSAGEMVLYHYRTTRSDLARVKGQVADLAGERRGHVSIACSQAVTPYFLPEQIAQYRKQHPGVTFAVKVGDRTQAEHQLMSFAADLALVFEPAYLVEFEVIQSLPQRVHAVLAADDPLATKTEVRLSEVLDRPCVIPSTQYGVRHLLDMAGRKRRRPLEPVVESDSFDLIRHYALHERAIGFQIPIGLKAPQDGAVVFRPLDERDVPAGTLFLGQKQGRTLPVASARFGMQVAERMARLGG
ncbi:LysR family transcriptional regulator [Roseospira marina]|uniref:LysR family transcriptional regulator n=1 Tax=Roseospira marina TaxID=140057 RepID=A0A5M6IAK4_9PROT|nr:LysR family transcriptional regulator [Roseospira marina]KAA5605300.1 LysR family transcriptional regulator [Roseospira marina]MBB4314768.1 DNA-binding transcriptional LysR family regulator [Roseospira marina]MBB5087757.1 DNA-binding transcriptional LysR family regulator [Roseospira marina]